MNKNFFCRMAAFILLMMIAVRVEAVRTVGPGFGHSTLFNEGWLFSLSDNQQYKEPGFNDNAWRKLNLPHDWSVEGQLSQDNASCTGYLPAGIAWYRKHFDMKVDRSQEVACIYFEGVYNRSEVYVNGHLLGKRPNGYVSFLYEMTPYLKEKDNVVAVRVDHSRIADSRWYTGSGIYRDVYLVKAPKTRFAQWGTTYWLEKLMDDYAVVKVSMQVENIRQGNAVRVSVLDRDGNEVSTKNESLRTAVPGKPFEMMVAVKNPQLWSIDSPYLYTLKCEVMQNGKTVDQSICSMGLRTLKFDANTGFELNGKNMKVKGVCLHHDAGVLGSAVPEEVWRRRVRALKLMGANAIRMSHNIQAPVLYDICDEEGMLVMDEGSDEWEFPKRKWITGWNNGTPGYDGTADFFEEWIDRDVRDMVLRDRNHPSVFLWSVGNEVDYPNDPYSHPVLDGTTINQPMFGGYKKEAPNAERIGFIAKRLAEVIRKADPSRPVTGALAGVVMSNQTIYPDVIDVVGYNYTENRYQEDHKTYPNRVLYGSETGVGYNEWKAVRDNDFIFGQFIWTGTDYLGESGRWPSRGLNTGLLNFGNFKKPRGWFRASLWASQPVAYVGTYPIWPQRNEGNGQGQRRQRRNVFSIDAADNWNYREGANVRVVCYTNQPQARLLLNGQEVGEPRSLDDATGMIHWDIPYQQGTLKAEALDANGAVTATYVIKTDGKPVALNVTDLTDEGLASGADKKKATLLQLLVNLSDEEGDIVKNADREITCHIQGDAELLGMEASNNSDMSDYTDNKQNSFRGSILVYVRKKSEKPVTLTFTADNVKQAVFTR